MRADTAVHFLAGGEDGADIGELVDAVGAEVLWLVRSFPGQEAALAGELNRAGTAVFRLLDAPLDPGQERDLHFLAALVCGLLARVGVDAGQSGAAQIHARLAFMCADRAGHPGLRMWIRIEQGRVAYWAGRPLEASRYCELALGVGAAVAGTLCPRAALQSARAAAAAGDAERARELLRRAAAARDSSRPDDLDALGGELTCPAPVGLFLEADTLSLLPAAAGAGGAGGAAGGDEAHEAAAAAVAAFDAAAARGERLSRGTAAASRVDLALARSRCGDLAGARHALDPVLTLPVERREAGLRVLLGRVLASLADPRHRGSPAARLMAAEIEGFTAARPAAALAT